MKQAGSLSALLFFFVWREKTLHFVCTPRTTYILYDTVCMVQYGGAGWGSCATFIYIPHVHHFLYMGVGTRSSVRYLFSVRDLFWRDAF